MRSVTFTEENYLKAIFGLSGEGTGRIANQAIADRLRIRPATVTEMLRKLRDKKLIDYSRSEGARLTELGRDLAAKVVRKHRLWETFLVRTMGFTWAEVHEVAEQLEHLQSEKLVEQMDRFLGYPRVDPHGEPIPDKEGRLRLGSYERLSSCKTGDAVRLCAVADSSTEFLTFLNGRGLRLGLRLTVRHVEPIDGSVILSYDKRRREMLSRMVCERLLVEKA